MMVNENKLKTWVLIHFGTIEACADAFDVSRNTVSRWINESPASMMKHADRITLMGLDVDELRKLVKEKALPDV